MYWYLFEEEGKKHLIHAQEAVLLANEEFSNIDLSTKTIVLNYSLCLSALFPRD